MFNIAALRFCLRENALEIYVSGCKGICKGCHNPNLWDPSVGEIWESFKDNIVSDIIKGGSLIKSIRIYGGELLEKEEQDILNFLEYLKTLEKEIWLFTRFDFSEVSESVKFYVDYIKCGQYDETQKENVTYYGVTLATKNQKIYKKGVDY